MLYFSFYRPDQTPCNDGLGIWTNKTLTKCACINMPVPTFESISKCSAPAAIDIEQNQWRNEMPVQWASWQAEPRLACPRIHLKARKNRMLWQQHALRDLYTLESICREVLQLEIVASFCRANPTRVRQRCCTRFKAPRLQLMKCG